MKIEPGLTTYTTTDIERMREIVAYYDSLVPGIPVESPRLVKDNDDWKSQLETE